MKKLFLLLALLTMCAGLTMAQNCGAGQQFQCHVTQTNAVTIVAQNADDFCVFVQGPEQVNITCYVQGKLSQTITKNFWAGACFSSNFNGTEVLWKICRVGNNINNFSWDVTSGDVEATGSF